MEDRDLRNFVIKGVDLDVCETISKLRFLSKIEENQKVNISSFSMVTDTFFNNVARTLGNMFVFNDSRLTTLRFIKQSTDDAIRIAEGCFADRDSALHRNIGMLLLAELKEVKSGHGIKSLMKTYKSDNMFIAELEAFQEVLKAKIIDIESRLENQ